MRVSFDHGSEIIWTTGVINMRVSRMIVREMKKDNTQIKIVKVPASKRPKAADLRKLDREIAAQVNANEAMSSRSVLYASRTSIR